MPEPVGPRIAAELEQLCSDLNTAGVPTTVEPVEVSVPGGWVAVRDLDPMGRLDGGGTLRVYLYLIVPDTGGVLASVKQLSTLLDRALTVVGDGLSESLQLAAAVTLPDQPSLPAYRLSVDLDI